MALNKDRQRLVVDNLIKACNMAIERLWLNNCEGEEEKFVAQLKQAVTEAEYMQGSDTCWKEYLLAQLTGGRYHNELYSEARADVS